MNNPKFINAEDFIAQLQSRGLLIVSARDFEIQKELERQKLMKRKVLSLQEIAKAGLLPVKTKKGVNDWIKSGMIHAGETFVEPMGRRRVMVLTSAIKRLGYGS